MTISIKTSNYSNGDCEFNLIFNEKSYFIKTKDSNIADAIENNLDYFFDTVLSSFADQYYKECVLNELKKPDKGAEEFLENFLQCTTSKCEPQGVEYWNQMVLNLQNQYGDQIYIEQTDLLNL